MFDDFNIEPKDMNFVVEQIEGKLFQKKLGVCVWHTLGCLHSHRIWRKPAAGKFQDDLQWQSELME